MVAGRSIHIEGFGLYRSFNVRLATGEDLNLNGYGFGGGITLQVVPKLLDVQFSGMAGRGIGRYGASQLPDVTFSGDGRIHPLHETILLAGATLHATPSLDLYVYAGEERVKRADFGSVAGVLYGYGNPLVDNSGCLIEGGTCNGNTPERPPADRRPSGRRFTRAASAMPRSASNMPIPTGHCSPPSAADRAPSRMRPSSASATTRSDYSRVTPRSATGGCIHGSNQPEMTERGDDTLPARRCLDVLLISGAVVALIAAVPAHAAPGPHAVSIRSSGLSQALSELASQTGAEMLFDATIVRNLRAQPVRGAPLPPRRRYRSCSPAPASAIARRRTAPSCSTDCRCAPSRWTATGRSPRSS